MSTGTTSVVHVIAASFRPDVPDDLLASTLAKATALRTAPGAQAGVVARSGLSVIVATWLDGRGGLEPFAASAPHMEFVMRGLAPSISSMWSAGFETRVEAPALAPGDTLWALAVRTAPIGIAGGLLGLSVNMPAYLLEAWGGVTEVGRYAAIFSVFYISGVLNAALGGAAIVNPLAEPEAREDLLRAAVAVAVRSGRIDDAVTAAEMLRPGPLASHWRELATRAWFEGTVW